MHLQVFHVLTRGRKHKQWRSKYIIQVRALLSPPFRISIQFLTSEVHNLMKRSCVSQSSANIHSALTILVARKSGLVRACSSSAHSSLALENGSLRTDHSAALRPGHQEGTYKKCDALAALPPGCRGWCGRVQLIHWASPPLPRTLPSRISTAGKTRHHHQVCKRKIAAPLQLSSSASKAYLAIHVSAPWYRSTALKGPLFCHLCCHLQKSARRLTFSAHMIPQSTRGLILILPIKWLTVAYYIYILLWYIYAVYIIYN